MSKTQAIVLLSICCLTTQLVADDGIIIRKNQLTLDQIERIYSEMPRLEYSPPIGRWKNLPKTKQRLIEGGTLRVVMLGDSIVNDTSRSCWNLLLEKRYPQCKVEKITSVRGSTGCWWYKELGRAQRFVLDHEPDLVIIGGISHRSDTDSIQEVVRQIRVGPSADILVMTGAFGHVDPRNKRQWKTISDPNYYSDYRKGLENLTRETGAAFLDMEAAWGEYIRQSGKDLEWFKRDSIHANERGEQTLGRILAAYLSPRKVAEATQTFQGQVTAAESISCPSFILSEHGCGRATAYSEFNKIVTIGRKIHVAWLDSENGQFLVRIRTFDKNTASWSPTFTVGQAYDNHGGPSLTSDSSGFLHIIYYPHHHPFRYRRSIRPNDASEWTEEIQFGKTCTYSSLICIPDGTLVLACRESTKQRWLLNLYEKPVGDVWQGPRTILHGQAPSGYTRWQAALALGRDRTMIHMSFMLYEQAIEKVGYAVGYLRSTDLGRSWQRSNGKLVTLPATPKTIEIVAGTATVDGPTNFRPGNIAIDLQGVPWLIYCRMDRQPFETWIARPDSKMEWQEISLLPAIQKKWPERAVKTPGNIVFGRDGSIYVAVTTVDSSIEDETALWGHPSTEVVLLVSIDQGHTFSVFQISRPDSSVPNWLPNLERPIGHQPIDVPSLIYTHGHRGKTNKQIMSNEVIWCDVPNLLAEEQQEN
ncbi:MAG: BNR-4 repeat-containing protein [Planctomycetota bacterium]